MEAPLSPDRVRVVEDDVLRRLSSPRVPSVSRNPSVALPMPKRLEIRRRVTYSTFPAARCEDIVDRKRTMQFRFGSRRSRTVSGSYLTSSNAFRGREVKFLYVDESGPTGDSDVFTMCGVMVDAIKLRKRTHECSSMIRELLGRYPGGSPPKELKTSQFINGGKSWSKLPPADRKESLREICKLAASEGGKVFGIGISLTAYKANAQGDRNSIATTDPWLSAAMFTMALVQKHMQKLNRNKGHTVVVMDDSRHLSAFTNAIHTADSWFDGLYQKQDKKKRGGKNVLEWTARKRGDRFNQIINTPFPIRSEHAPFVQVADAVSYVYRRHLELLAGDTRDGWDDEDSYYDELAQLLDKRRERLGRCPPVDCVDYYKSICHAGWRL